MMKFCKRFALFLALCLALPLWGLAQEEIHRFEGYVTEVLEDGFVMEDIHRGQVILNTDDSTVWDGVLIDGTLEAGLYVLVDYDGRLTRSIPPQAHADRVGCYPLQGTISELTPEGMLLSGDELFGDVWVNLNLVDASHAALGMQALVYYDGVMAMSLPGRVSAYALVLPSLSGTISEKTEDSFLLTTEGGEAYLVSFTADTLCGLVSASEEETEEEPLVEDDVPADLPTIEWGDGDKAVVYYSGDIQTGDPEQIAAMEICILR